VFVLGVVVSVLRGGVGWVSAPAFGGEISPLSLGLLLVGLVISAAFGVAATAVLARGYRQISPDDAVRSGSIGD